VTDVVAMYRTFMMQIILPSEIGFWATSDVEKFGNSFWHLNKVRELTLT
jgi:hypothetical protein